MRRNNILTPVIPFRQKIFLITSGMFFFLILLEISLRLGGFIFLSLQEHRNRAAIYAKGTYRIMCLGESTTALGGKDSYPYQLREILNQRNPGIKFSVINKGVVGVDTSAIVSSLSRKFNRYSPDMAIVMMGINDELNILPYRPASKGMLFLESLRIYKLTRLLWLNILAKPKENTASVEEKPIAIKEASPKAAESNSANDSAYIGLGLIYRFRGEYNQAEAVLKKAIELNPRSYDTYVQLGRFYKDRNKHSRAKNIFTKVTELSPQSEQAYQSYIELGWIYRDQKKLLAEAAFKKAIELDPRRERAYIELGWVYRLQGKYSQAEEILQKGLKYVPRSDKIYGGLLGLYQEMGKPESARQCYNKINNLRSEYRTPATAQNYLRLKEILDKRGIKLVCVQYPMRSLEPLKKIFQGQQGVIFVDNETVFKEALARASYQDYFTDMFGGYFGHCTRKGNRLLAENIANVILKECFDINDNSTNVRQKNIDGD